MTPFKFGFGATLGTGQQWMSWIHVKDLVAAIDFLINNQQLNGPFNLTTPYPVTNKEFSQRLAKSMNRPCLFKIPGRIVKLIFGEMGDTLLLNGQKVIPDRLIRSGYTFKFPNLNEALEDLKK